MRIFCAGIFKIEKMLRVIHHTTMTTMTEKSTQLTEWNLTTIPSNNAILQMELKFWEYLYSMSALSEKVPLVQSVQYGVIEDEDTKRLSSIPTQEVDYLKVLDEYKILKDEGTFKNADDDYKRRFEMFILKFALPRGYLRSELKTANISEWFEKLVAGWCLFFELELSFI